MGAATLADQRSGSSSAVPTNSAGVLSVSVPASCNGGDFVFVTVTRTGGSTGAVGCTLNTSGGTAVAGVDYDAITNQAISLADGVTSAQWPLKTDVASQPVAIGLTLNLVISSPTGGATLGTASAPTTINQAAIAAGLTPWYKADALVLNNNDPVATWIDSSSGGNDATQGTAGKKPLYKTSVLNSKPVVRFDGVDDFLRTAAFGSPFAQPNTIFLVGKKNGTGTQAYFDGITSHRNAIFNFPDGTLDLFAGGGADTVAGTITNAVFMLLTAQFNGASSFGRTNGSANTVVNPGTNDLTLATLGADFNATPGNTLNGDIAEVLVYNAALTAPQITQVETYLNAKWAIF